MTKPTTSQLCRTPILPPPLPPSTAVQYALFYCLDMPPKLFTIKSQRSAKQGPSPLAPPEEPAYD